mmetsp:Transcript_36068/g.54376  ORF Transcript_36068/g.54376 Transcript_36068/m.54376 type:complete len:465 (-) Transcript_36068:584-1978(-)
MLINGKLVEGEGTFDVINPSTGEVFAQAPECSEAQLDEAVRAAREAFPGWSKTQVKDRQAAMAKAAKILEKNVDALVETLVKEQGKPTHLAKQEIQGCIATMQHAAERDFQFEKVIVDDDKEKVIQKYVPLGVVGGITPWNFPPLMATWKFVEALTMGNTCIIKPSHFTPLSTLHLGELLKDAFPPGVLAMLTGDKSQGKWLVAHKDVDKISFTGSTRAGISIQKAAADTLKRVVLELGGNDAAIVLDDADPKEAAKGLFDFAMSNSGQVCIAIKRAYVHETLFQQVTEELARLAKDAKVDDGFKEGVTLGPMNNKMQLEKVVELVNDAKAAGAKILASGEAPEGKGYFFPPTIITEVKEGVRIVDEEQFGPVLPVMPYSNIDEAVERANSSEYGLGASVWSSNLTRAQEVADRLHSGTVWINKHADLSPNVPFGGAKASGIGRQLGDYTMESNMEAKIIRIAK